MLSANRHRCNPLLVNLGIVQQQERQRRQRENEGGGGGGGAPITAVDVLSYLLDKNLLSEQSLRDAHRDLLMDDRNNNDIQNPSSSQQQQESPQHPDPAKKKAPSLPPLASTSTSAPEAEAVLAAAAAAAADNDETTAVALDEKQQQRERRKRHIALKVYYDGSAYTGLAQHYGQDSDNSIEKHLFKAMSRAHLIDNDEDENDNARDESESHTYADNGRQYSRCGRTDKGVSSNGQVIALKLNSAFASDASLDSEGKILLENEDLPNNSYDTKTVYMIPRTKKAKTKKKMNKINNNNSNNNNMGTTPTTMTQQQIRRCQRVMTEYAYDKILNNLLPDDIRVQGWCPVSNDFSARFSATSRTYRYFFLNNNNRQSMRPRQQQQQTSSSSGGRCTSSRAHARTSHDLDLDAMRDGLRRMAGTHDFRNLCKMNVEAVSNFVRTIHKAELVIVDNDGCDDPSTNVCYFQIVGQAFLWHQIRCIVSILFMIGRHLESPSIITELLNVQKNPCKPSYELAPAEHLVLHDCKFQNLHIGYSVQNLYHIHCQQLYRYEQYMLAAARIRNFMEGLKIDAHVLVDDVTSFVNSKLTESREKRGKSKVNTNEILAVPHLKFNQKIIRWKEALDWMSGEEYNIVPEPIKTGSKKQTIHVPLLERSMGTTYEEKVASIVQQSSSSKRKQRYEENIIRKRKTKEEDKAFYQHMAQQGSTKTCSSSS